jgi:hypothetical protein
MGSFIQIQQGIMDTFYRRAGVGVSIFVLQLNSMNKLLMAVNDERKNYYWN